MLPRLPCTVPVGGSSTARLAVKRLAVLPCTLPLARRALPLARRPQQRRLAAAGRSHQPLRSLATTSGAAPEKPCPIDTAWDALSEGQQSAAIVLGWTQETWGDGLHVPPLSSGLSAKQTTAVRDLGYLSVEDWDALPRGWVEAGSAAPEEEEPAPDTDWSGTGSDQHEQGGDSSSTGGISRGLSTMALRLLAAVIAGAALCVGAEEVGLLPDAPAPAKPAATE